MLTDEQIIKFQALWNRRFNEDISREQALTYGIKLIRLLQIVYTKPLGSDFTMGTSGLVNNILK